MTDPGATPNVKVITSRFGELEVPETQVITLPHGMIGFPSFRRYVLIQHREGSPFFWLQSLDSPDLAFVVVSPILFEPQYQVTLGDSETKILQIEDPKDIQVWVVVTIPHGQPDKMTANLKAPLVINLGKRLAAQLILDDPRFSMRHPISQPAAGQGQAKEGQGT